MKIVQLKSLKHLGRDRSGVSAVEFALIAPILIAMYLGMADLSQGFMAQRRVDHIASAVADLTSQAQTVSLADLTDEFKVGNLMMAPFSSSGLKQRVTSVNCDANGKTTVLWSVGSGLTAFTTNSTLSVPANVVAKNQTVIRADVSYVYTSPVNYVLKTPITFTQSYYLRPRVVDSIPYTG
jgi:Flp pilus assembly protein TadG